MKINENVAIVGEKVILIPYESVHVEKYHEWMKSPELQELTASESLSLDEEYEMQKSWRNDDDKCTFLILKKEEFLITKNEIECLIGDTNLFIHLDHEAKEKIAEAEIMIAEERYRGQGLGTEAMLLMLNYGQKELKVDKFIAKIGETNQASTNMFKKIHFKEISKCEAFKEITLECSATESWRIWLQSKIKFASLRYDNLQDSF